MPSPCCGQPQGAGDGGLSDGIDFKELDRRIRDKLDYAADTHDATDKAGLKGARVCERPLDRYYVKRTISLRQHDAGIRFARYYETGSSVMSCQQYDGIPIQESFGPRSLPTAAIEAWTAYTRIVQRLGIRMSTPLIVICCYGETIEVAYQVKRDGRPFIRAIGQFQQGLDMVGDIVGMEKA